MQTELQAISSARTQYRANFKTMCMGANWDLCLGSCGVVLDRAFEHSNILVRDVQCMSEEIMVQKLVTQWRALDWSKVAHHA